MQKSYTKRFESFEKSLSNLEKARSEDKNNIFVLSGIIMIFNLTFDLAWKLIKDVLKEDHGVLDFPAGSPRETLKKARSVNLISDELWLDMLDDRNDLTHDYDFNLATEKCNTIINGYLPLLSDLRNKIKEKL